MTLASFPKILRIRNRRDFRRLRSGSRKSGKYIFIESVPSDRLRLGLTVSRRFGSAAARNRFKRITREAFRLSRQKISHTLDLNIRPLPAAMEASTEDIARELVQLLL